MIDVDGAITYKLLFQGEEWVGWSRTCDSETVYLALDYSYWSETPLPFDDQEHIPVPNVPSAVRNSCYQWCNEKETPGRVRAGGLKRRGREP